MEPRIEGNIGAIARGMKNFGFEHLRLIRPVPLIDEAFRRAKHAREILEHAKFYPDLQTAVTDLDLVVGTSGVAVTDAKKHHRNALEPAELPRQLEHFDGQVGVLFGSEDTGLSNEILARCDLFVTIPTAPAYPILNLSHAVTIILYELYQSGRGRLRQPSEADGIGMHVPLPSQSEPGPNFPKHLESNLASREERELLLERFLELERVVSFPVHHRERLQVLFRRLLGRAGLSKWEYHRLMGLFTRTLAKLEQLESVTHPDSGSDNQ